ncbi:TetR-like C-terminal domain-containing protein [Streptomyces sp. NPDC093544]|uniref:TetR-like C-terminal domain-containing protein n=1 Tax=Streptomyces sp. NPDC093544 TaxID=3155200 RepID=UPI003446012E
MRQPPAPRQLAPTARTEGKTVTRRRGRELEQAILRAALDELTETGYVGLTVEAVAARARTSRPVLHRRWPTRAELVIAALSDSHLRADDLPDNGSLRSDLIALLQRFARRFVDVGAEVFWGLMSETARDPRLSALVRTQFARTLRQEELTTALLDRAVARGEIGPDRPASRVLRLPLDLLRHDVLIHGEVSDETIISIVDEVLLPLLLPGTQSP